MSEPHVAEVPGGHRYLPPDGETSGRRFAAADKPGEHLWIMTVAWLVPDPRAMRDPANPALLDQENILLAAGPGCYKCEMPYSNRLAKRVCRGSIDQVQPPGGARE